jgi:hypothetical protein
MAPELMNPVFRVIESRWRGLWPCTAQELSAGGVLGVLVLLLSERPVLALLAWAAATLALVAVRRLDHDRTDALWIWFRSRQAAVAYSLVPSDTTHRPFRAREPS